MMPSPDYIGFLYAATVALGGIMGYVKAGSVPSLAAGLAFGFLAGAGAYQTTYQPKNVSVMLATSTILAGVMGHRYYRSQKIFPAGFVCGLSVAMMTRSCYRAIA